jgi:hypothetical protein
MAAYAAAVVSPLLKTKKIAEDVAIYYGRCDITNYNVTAAEITGITKKFKDGNPIVICSGVSESGYLVHWDRTDKAFHAFYPTIASDQTPTADIVAAAGTEVVDDVDVGEVQFIAIGLNG